MPFFTNVPNLPAVDAHDHDETWLHVICPECENLTLVSRGGHDGEMAECDVPGCLAAFWIYGNGHR